MSSNPTPVDNLLDNVFDDCISLDHLIARVDDLHVSESTQRNVRYSVIERLCKMPCTPKTVKNMQMHSSPDSGITVEVAVPSSNVHYCRLRKARFTYICLYIRSRALRQVACLEPSQYTGELEFFGASWTISVHPNSLSKCVWSEAASRLLVLE